MKFPDLNSIAVGTGKTGGTDAPAPGSQLEKTDGPAPLVTPFGTDAHTFQPINNGLVYTAPAHVDSAKYRTDPLPIGWVHLHTKGQLALSLCPGKGGPTASKDNRPRHLGRDLDQLNFQAKIGVLVPLIEAFEFTKLGVPNLIGEATARGMTVKHYPIQDVNVPKDMGATRDLVKGLVADLEEGKNVFIHCRGGLGRTGTIAACILVEMGWGVEEAIADTRKARPGALETSGQEKFVAEYAKFKAAADEAKAAEPPPAAQAAPTETAAASKVTIPGLRPELNLKFEDLASAGSGPTGSNPGGWFKVKDEATSTGLPAGTRFYVKTTRTDRVWSSNPAEVEARIKNEIVASKLYELTGVEAPQLTEVKINGSLKGQPFSDRIGLASRIIEGLHGESSMLTSNPGALPGVFEGFGTHCWLSNWDAIGLGYDNTLAKTQGEEKKAVCIEVGGALLYRAMGEAKGARFGDKVTEIESLRDPKINPQASEVYKHMSPAQIEASMVPVLRVKDDAIRAVVTEYGPGDDAAKKALADRLIARKQDIATRFPNAAKLAAES